MKNKTVILLFGAVNNKETVKTVILNSVQNSVAIPIRQIFTKYYSIIDDFKLDIYNFRSFLNHNSPHAVINNYINSLCDDNKSITIIDDVLFQVEYDALLKTCNVISLVCMKNKDGSHPWFNFNVPDFYKINMDNIVSQLSDIPNIPIQKPFLKKSYGCGQHKVKQATIVSNDIYFDLLHPNNSTISKRVVYTIEDFTKLLEEYFNFDKLLEFESTCILFKNGDRSNKLDYHSIPDDIF